VRALNELLNRALHVDIRIALNDDPAPIGAPVNGIAGELKRIMNELKAQAYDAQRKILDYPRVKGSECYADLRRCTAQLNHFDPGGLQTDAERLAFWINLYNVLIVDAVISFGISRTVWEDRGFFRRAAYRIGGLRCSADEIEHGILRGNRHPPYLPFLVFAGSDPRRQWAVQRLDPRVHAALNCASRSCPPIGVYDEEVIDEQLELAAKGFVNATTHVSQSGVGRVHVRLSPIFKWYAADFGGRAGALEFVAKYLTNEQERARMKQEHERLKPEWADYDWSLNG
jgi:Protein of unknown function, DUF547